MKLLLFSSGCCAPCAQLKKYLGDIGLTNDVLVIQIDDEDDNVACENLNLAKIYGVTQVPTLVKTNNDKEEISRMVGFGNVNKIDEFVGV